MSARARHGRRRHDRRGRRAPAGARRATGRCACRTSATRRTGCASAARSTRGDLRDPERGARGGRRLLARGPPGGDRRRYRELPQASAHAARGQQRALQRRLPRGARRAAWSGSSTCRRRWCSSARPSSRPPRSTCATARRRARRTASRSSPARSTAARCTTSTGCPTRSAARSTRTARASCPDDEPGIAHMVPDLIRKVLAGQRPLPIFGSGEQTRTLTHVDDIADGIVTALGHPAARERGLQHLGVRGADRGRDRASSSGRRAGDDPAEFELEHLPSFEVDVQRRWPSVEKARRAARLGGAGRPRGRHRGHRRWLRGREEVAH